jgi:hypothetical protein
MGRRTQYFVSFQTGIAAKAFISNQKSGYGTVLVQNLKVFLLGWVRENMIERH